MLVSVVRPIGPILVGVSLGFTLSLLSVTWVHENCDSDGVRATEEMLVFQPDGLKGARKPSSISTGTTDNGNTEEDLRPRIVSYNQPAPQGPQKKVFRAKYASVELGIRERLFVAILTSKTSLSTQAIAVNRTLRHHVEGHVVFLTGSHGPKLPHGMPVFAHGEEHSGPAIFQVLRYLLERHAADYDWFYLLWDDTYVQPDRLKALVSHLSMDRWLYMGQPEEFIGAEAPGRYCRGGAGILLSRALLLRLQPYLEPCRTHVASARPDEWLGRCIVDYTGISCVEQHEGLQYNSFEMEESAVLNAVERVDLQKALTVHPVSPEQMYRLHRSFTQRELQDTYQQIQDLQVEMKRVSCCAVDGNRSAAWPVGVPPPFWPRSRFEVLRWEYFSEEELFSCADGAPKCQLSEADRQDVADVIQEAVRELSEKYAPAVVLSAPRLVNGYRRFDPTRGMEYMLDLQLHAQTESGRSRALTRRVHMVRPLSQVEIIPMPSVTEGTRVHLLLPVSHTERGAALRFLERCGPVVFEAGENAALTLLLLYHPDEAKRVGGTADIFAELKAKAAVAERGHPDVEVSWVSVRTEGPGLLRALDAASRKHAADALLLLVTVDTVLNGDVLNRCRVNAIAGWQVFFPVHFQAFDPRVTHPHGPPPTAPDLVREAGHFDRHAFGEACFYNGDYVASRARQSAESHGDELSEDVDAYDVFLCNSHLHVFRGVEPALWQAHRRCACEPQLGDGALQRCLQGNLRGLGSQSQLAMLLFDQEQTSTT
ncbi:hypothetical protein P4O66_006978 [Electrophorus voltai]|uniref:Hexosyltransferase n=1 Tax=Electrophorus voltai TaxID=2609070 RepID=A0AAD8ZGH9_9TELE|nr:hypothetical protein P4O66_006978 [Electrophorus voltai]